MLHEIEWHESYLIASGFYLPPDNCSIRQLGMHAWGAKKDEIIEANLLFRVHFGPIVLRKTR